MGDSRKKADWPIVAALVTGVALLVAPTLYGGGYFETSKFYIVRRHVMCRDFSHRWQVEFYDPLLKIESALSGQRVWPSPSPRSNQPPKP